MRAGARSATLLAMPTDSTPQAAPPPGSGRMFDRIAARYDLLNRLISLSFARQLHERFFPGPVTDELNRDVLGLSVDVRRDSVKELREVFDFVTSADIRDKALVRRYAVSKAMAINARDLEWRARTEALWHRLNRRGMALMALRGARQDAKVRMGWGVAAGS